MKKILIVLFMLIAVMLSAQVWDGEVLLTKYFFYKTDVNSVKNMMYNGDGDSLFFQLSDGVTDIRLYPNPQITTWFVPYTGADSTLNMGVYDVYGDSLDFNNGTIDTLSIDEMLITTVYIDSGSVIWTDYDDLSDVASYADTVFSFHKDVVFDLTITASNLSGTNTGDQDLSDYPKSSGTSPNIPYYAANDSLTATLIEYSASQTTFNQNVIADTLTVTVMTTDSIYAEKGTIDTLACNTISVTGNITGTFPDSLVQDLTPYAKSNGTSPNIPYYAANDSLTATLIEYSSTQTVFNQNVVADTLTIDGLKAGNEMVGRDTLASGTSSKSVLVSGCTAADYIFVQAGKPAGGVDILPLFVDVLADSFIVYTDNADTLGVDLPFNWLKIRGK